MIEQKREIKEMLKTFFYTIREEMGEKPKEKQNTDTAGENALSGR